MSTFEQNIDDIKEYIKKCEKQSRKTIKCGTLVNLQDKTGIVIAIIKPSNVPTEGLVVLEITLLSCGTTEA